MSLHFRTKFHFSEGRKVGDITSWLFIAERHLIPVVFFAILKLERLDGGVVERGVSVVPRFSMVSRWHVDKTTPAVVSSEGNSPRERKSALEGAVEGRGLSN